MKVKARKALAGMLLLAGLGFAQPTLADGAAAAAAAAAASTSDSAAAAAAAAAAASGSSSPSYPGLSTAVALGIGAAISL